MAQTTHFRARKYLLGITMVAFCNSLRIDPGRFGSFFYSLGAIRFAFFSEKLFVESIWIALARSGSDVQAKVSSAHIRHVYVTKCAKMGEVEDTYVLFFNPSTLILLFYSV